MLAELDVAAADVGQGLVAIREIARGDDRAAAERLGPARAAADHEPRPGC